MKKVIVLFLLISSFLLLSWCMSNSEETSWNDKWYIEETQWWGNWVPLESQSGSR